MQLEALKALCWTLWDTECLMVADFAEGFGFRNSFKESQAELVKMYQLTIIVVQKLRGFVWSRHVPLRLLNAVSSLGLRMLEKAVRFFSS